MTNFDFDTDMWDDDPTDEAKALYEYTAMELLDALEQKGYSIRAVYHSPGDSPWHKPRSVKFTKSIPLNKGE